MAGGQKIDDHSFWAGKRSKASVFPEGVHTKESRSAETAGAENEYEDTDEAIHRAQNMNSSKTKAHPLKSGYRN